MITKLIEAGMNISRMNFSHGSHEYHANTIKNVRQAAEAAGAIIAVALDTKGPEIRTGLLTGDVASSEIELFKDAQIRITTNDEYKAIHPFPSLRSRPVLVQEKVSKDFIWVDYKNIPKVVKKGYRIFIDDGLISLLVEEIGSAFLP